MVSSSTFTRRGARPPIGGGRSTGSRTIEIGLSALTILLTLCANGTGPFAGCAWYMRGLLGSSAALALLPNSRDNEHSSVSRGSDATDVTQAATIMPAIAAPIPTITRSFLFFGSFMAVTPSTRFTFECTIGSRGQRSLRCNKRAADRQNAARGRPSCTRSSPTNRKPGWRSPTQRICEISNPRFDIREAASANATCAIGFRPAHS